MGCMETSLGWAYREMEGILMVVAETGQVVRIMDAKGDVMEDKCKGGITHTRLQIRGLVYSHGRNITVK